MKMTPLVQSYGEKAFHHPYGGCSLDASMFEFSEHELEPAWTEQTAIVYLL